jgi:hypothetical protein
MIWECQGTRDYECSYFAWDRTILGPIDIPKFSNGLLRTSSPEPRNAIGGLQKVARICQRIFQIEYQL